MKIEERAKVFEITITEEELIVLSNALLSIDPNQLVHGDILERISDSINDALKL